MRGGDYVEICLDMTGHWADMLPYGKLNQLCLVVEPDPGLGNEAQNDAVHKAALVVNDQVAAATKELTPPQLDVYELSDVDPALPKIIYIWCVHSPQAMSGSPTAFCTMTYGLTQLTPPWFLHPNEILDGALSGPYRTAFAMSWTVVNKSRHDGFVPPARGGLEFSRGDDSADGMDHAARKTAHGQPDRQDGQSSRGGWRDCHVGCGRQ